MGFAQQFGALLTAIADEADAMSMRAFRADDLHVERKRDGTALTQADGAIEAMARAKVAASGIALDVLGEEMGTSSPKSAAKAANSENESAAETAISLAGSSARARLIIDPIDGTEEFSRGIPTFGTLLGIELNGEIVAGVASAPALGTRWWAYRDEGAFRNGQRIHVSDTTQLSEAMVFTTGTGPSKNADDRARIRRLSDASRNSRALGGFWQHMLVAEGAIDAALDWTSKPWDLAPLGIIVEEAGGRSTNLAGERTIYTGDYLSTNGKLHDEVLKLLR
ncbi:MAG TPA: inositol monophosphatase family protein [Candidatus Eisenbacteria bacterium]|jgi:histidinol-phosphatase|nr:inositol monophosphatase family protein [Candidatus Eisenbacteria bacterium]